MLAAATIILAVGSDLAAQTLAQPDPATKSSPSPSSVAPKLRPTARAKACAQYGAGFAPMPGTGACIKVGGFIEGTAGSSR